MLKTYLGQSIVVLFTISAMFFCLIFLIGTADNTKTDNSIMNIVPLQQSEIDRWGQIPGSFGYDFRREVTIYSQQSFDPNAKTINLETANPI